MSAEELLRKSDGELAQRVDIAHLSHLITHAGGQARELQHGFSRLDRVTQKLSRRLRRLKGTSDYPRRLRERWRLRSRRARRTYFAGRAQSTPHKPNVRRYGR